MTEWQVTAYFQGSAPNAIWYTEQTPSFNQITTLLKSSFFGWSADVFQLVSFRAGDGTPEKPACFTIAKIGESGILTFEVEANRLPVRNDVC